MHKFTDGDIESFNTVNELDGTVVRLFIHSGTDLIILTKEDLEYLLEQVTTT